ncbi:PAAR domain-containing protein [Pseudomonas panipatensis]|uniref:PAAR domain-containing protein n=1 Tax=Pseudomonas panipatensis TaxID=428992 RepID=UPI0035B090C4
MAIGYFIRQGDKTTCGGTVLEADSRCMMFGIARARQGDRVSCGKDGKVYQIVGGVTYIISHGQPVAGSLDSFSGCPCKARLIPSLFTATYHSKREAPRVVTTSMGAAAFNDSQPISSPPNSSYVSPSRKKYARCFSIVDSEFGLPLAGRAYVALVDGKSISGTTNDRGLALVEAPSADSAIFLHVVFRSPARHLDEFKEELS